MPAKNNRFIIDRHIHMNSISSDRKRHLYSLFALISAILSLGHFVVLEFSTTLAQEVDEQDKQSIPGWNVKQNIPFAAVVGIFAAAQFCASLAILISNRKQGAAGTLYYNSLVALLAAFAIGVDITILASEYNTWTRGTPKDQTVMPSLMPFYWTLQVDATATFLFSVPLLLFIFYNNLEDFLREQREKNQHLTMAPAQALNKQIWLLAFFLLNAFAHIAFIYNIYQFTGIEETVDYHLDDSADQYTFYIAVEVIVCLVALIVQIKHFKSPFLKKSQLILVATLAAVFQFGSFILLAIKAVQFHLDIALMENGNCRFKDCNEAGVFRWEITGYTILTFLVLAAQVPYFSVISNIVEHDGKRDTLMTEENYQA